MADSDPHLPPFRDPPPFSAEAQGLSLRFYPGGHDRLEALIGLIERARKQLKLCFYIFATDESAARVRDALTAAAERGVDVRLIVDSFGAVADERFFAPVITAGGSYACFMGRWSRRYLIRNHQKMVIADGRVAMLGGFNVENAYFTEPSEDGWNDLAFTVEGAVVARLDKWFDQLEDWATHPRAQFRSIRRAIRGWKVENGRVQVLVGGPTTDLSSWAREVGHDLVEGDRLDMMMAYFSPPPRLIERMCRIAHKGQTRLLLPARSDNGATVGASRALYGKLLKAGARIWEFQPCKLHTKLIILDDAVYLGSANFDMRSLFLNLEIVLKIEDAELADRLRRYFEHHLPASQEITREVHRARATWFNRLRWRVSWFLVAVVDYTVSRRLNLGQ